jgi:uncharacterized protein with NAD-binding domain and iron-sulfur cluster
MARGEGPFLPSLIDNTTADVCIIGAGIVGMSTAYLLTQAGLSLAGDYTRQPYIATMEGAVVSGKLAADAVEAACQTVDFPTMAGAVMR